MDWPTGEDFMQLVSTAMKDRSSQSGVRMRDALAEPDIVGETVAALEAIVARIDERLALPEVDGDVLRRREGARDQHYSWLVWYRQLQVLANG